MIPIGASQPPTCITVDAVTVGEVQQRNRDDERRDQREDGDSALGARAAAEDQGDGGGEQRDEDGQWDEGGRGQISSAVTLSVRVVVPVAVLTRTAGV